MSTKIDTIEELKEEIFHYLFKHASHCMTCSRPDCGHANRTLNQTISRDIVWEAIEKAGTND